MNKINTVHNKELIINEPKNYHAILVLAHGAGAPMDSDWMNTLSQHLLNLDIKVIRFEFPYMKERRHEGTKRPPNKADVLKACFESIIEMADKSCPLYIGGKSMGGRIASLIANQSPISGLICLGFPFHAPKKAIKDRLDLLLNVQKQTLILQGERDNMGSREELESIPFPPHFTIKYIEDGDHSFKPRKSSGHSLEEHLFSAAESINHFILKNNP